MGILTNVFYLISTSLLIPVMLALLWCLARVLLLLGRTLREHLTRLRVQTRLAEFSAALDDGRESLPELPATGPVVGTVARLLAVADNEVLAEKAVHDAEIQWQAELERLRGLSRFAPTLGLMGTLIPLGPALVGLAAGDLQTMSDNLVIAFATTVVGLLVGTLAAAMLGVKKAWYRADALLVVFAANRLPQLSAASGWRELSTANGSANSGEDANESFSAASISGGEE